MRTQKYFQVEAIIAKYEKLAYETSVVQETINGIDDLGFTSDFQRLQFVEQLIGHIYKLRAGNQAHIKVVEEYREITNCYMPGLITGDEESFLVDNFDVFIDYAFDHLSVIASFGLDCSQPQEWSALVPYLLEKHSGRIFIPNSDNGREFVGLESCELVVDTGFVNAAMRSYVCGHRIERYVKQDSADKLWSDLPEKSFDAVIVEMSSDSSCSIEEGFYACNRIVKEGGEILFCVPKEAVLGGKMAFLSQYIRTQKTLQDTTQLPSGNFLFHFVKKAHDSFVMCDATSLAQTANRKVVDVPAFLKEFEMAGMPEREECPLVCRFAYEDMNADILLPSYYLQFFKEGKEVSKIIDVPSSLVISDECLADDHVLTVNHLSNVFSKGEFSVDSLPLLRTDRIRRYYHVTGPAVVVAVSDKEVAVGYTRDNTAFLVPKNLYVLKPKEQIDVRFLACQFLSTAVKNQIVKLVYGRGIGATLTSSWTDLIRLDIPSIEDQQKYVQDIILKDFSIQEEYVRMREKGFKHSIRLRKHALSQNVSAFDSLFRSVEYCMQEHNGRLFEKDLLSPVSSMTVGEAMGLLRTKLRTICERVSQLSDEQDWGACEVIEPQSFLEEYEMSHQNTTFKFEHLWEDFDSNRFEKDIFDKETGKLLFHKGESMNAAWFPKRALVQVLDNIVANACEHGFTDAKRNDYIVQTNWTTDGLNMLLTVANNGTPIPSDINSDLILEYGYSSQLNQGNHGGIGGGEIADIMRKYGGDVKVISTPEKGYTVTYELRLPLASVY